MAKSKTPAVTQSDCEQWFSNRGVNPLTRRGIKPHGPTYAALERACEPYTRRAEANVPASTASDPVVDPEPTPSSCPVIRSSPHVRIRQDASVINSARKDMHDICAAALLDDVGLAQVRELYARYNIVEAPLHFNSTHTILPRIVIASFLAAWQGAPFMPHMLTSAAGNRIGIRGTDAERVFGWYFDTLDLTVGLPDAVKATQKSSRRYHVMLTSNKAMQGAGGTHALLVVVEKTQPARGRMHARSTLHVIDPVGEVRRTNYRVQLLGKIRALYPAAGSSRVIKVDSGDESLEPRMFQAIEQLPSKSKLERGGHCLLWMCLMGEALVQHESTVGTIYDEAGSRKPIHILRELFGGIPLVPAVWKKLIIDYAFSRALAIYVTLRKFHPHECEGTYIHDAMKHYVDRLDVDAYYEDLVARLPSHVSRRDFELKVSRPIVHTV